MKLFMVCIVHLLLLGLQEFKSGQSERRYENFQILNKNETQDSIKLTLKEMGVILRYMTYSTQVNDCWRAFVNTTLSLRVP